MECPKCHDADLYAMARVGSVMFYTDEDGEPTEEMVERGRDLLRCSEVAVECTNCGYVHSGEASASSLVIDAAPELYMAAVTMYGLTTNLKLSEFDASDVETGRRQLLAALRLAGFGKE